MFRRNFRPIIDFQHVTVWSWKILILNHIIWNFKFCIKNSLLVKVECYKISFMLFSLFKKLTQNIIIIKLYNNLQYNLQSNLQI